MKFILPIVALLLSACGDVPPPAGEPTAGSINCTLDGRNCEPGQKR